MTLGPSPFADEGPVGGTSIDVLPASMEHGKPCRNGHADSEGRGLRYRQSGACVVCERANRDRYRGHEGPTLSLEEIVALALARERRLADEEIRRRTPKRRGLRTVANARGKSYTPPPARRDTGVVCAADGCSVVLTRIAAEHGDPYCSRVCAGFLTPLERGAAHDDEPDDDASDDALQGVENAAA